MYGGETGGSQGAYGGGGFVSSPGNAENVQGSQREKRSNKSDAVLPFTVKIMSEVLEGGNASLDDNIMYFGQEVHNVTIVGKLKAIQEVATHSSYKIHDGTGSIEVKYYNDSKDEQGGAGGQDAVQEGTYVRVFGHLRALQGKKMVVALSIRPVTDPNEITFHMLEVIYSRERLKGKGGLKGATPQSAAGKAPPYSTPAAAAGGYGAGAGAGANAWGAPQQQQQPAKSGGVFTPLAQELQRLFESAEVAAMGDSGVSFDKVMDMLDRRYPGPEVRSTLENLMTEGSIFTTVDDNHFKSTSN